MVRGYRYEDLGLAIDTSYWDPRNGGIATAIADDAATPERFSLMQNYPNPFNPVTVIGYAIPEKMDVSLKIFDALGGAVATLVDGENMAGFHRVEFDATGLANGVYFSRLSVGEHAETRKMILMK